MEQIKIAALLVAKKPQCEGLTGDAQNVRCIDQASWTVDGKHFCKRHAMAYVFNRVVERGKS